MLQHFLMPDAAAVVRPASIGADLRGNVHIPGTTTHGLGAAAHRVLLVMMALPRRRRRG